MKRIVIPELLDDDLGTPAAVAASLRDLRHINQWFGGVRTTTQLLARVAQQCSLESMSLLEIGAGSGDVPLEAKRQLGDRGIELDVMLLDRVASHLPRDGVRSLVADALRLPFRDDTFDVVGCTLFAHHFEPDTLASLASEALRVASKAVLINDLIRSRLHLSLTYAGLPLFRSRITWHDAPASVRRAYTLDEMRQVLSRVSAKRVDLSTHYLYRMGVLLWK